VSVSPGVPLSLQLEAGNWTITAKAMAGNVEKANGAATVPIPPSGIADAAITLSPVVGSPATGTLAYTLYYPNGATGSLSLEDTDGNPEGSPVNIPLSETEDTITLNPGSYLATVSLTKGTETAGRVEAIHIVAGLTTRVAYNFYEDLAAAPTPISNATELAAIGANSASLAGRYALTQDISLSDWVPLGSLTNPIAPFTGSLDGKGHTITITSFDGAALEDKQYIGIFAAVQGESEHNKARVKNLTIASSVSINALSTTVGQGLGLVSGYAENAVISGIELSGSLSIIDFTKAIFVGGIVGDMRQGAELRDCTSAMDLSATRTASETPANPPYTGAPVKSTVGGLVGFFLTSADGSEYGEGIDVLIKGCSNSGDVSAMYSFRGGIAGGWGTTPVTTLPIYLGRVEDCVYSGSILGDNGERSGGIVGSIGGNGGNAANEANTSRILRCRTLGSPPGTAPADAKKIKAQYMAGGIAGDLFNGALIERCSSSTTIESDSRAGGITGDLGAQARIYDCWSLGSVTGSGTVAGIAAGLNTANIIITRCYSRAAVSSTSTNGSIMLGGIISTNNNTGTVTKCVALNDSITAAWANSSSALRRVWGAAAAKPNAIMNYGQTNIPVTFGTTQRILDPVKDRDGIDLEEDPPGRWLYEGTLGWDFVNVWEMGSDGYPRLRGID
jgi:hypothetical protein